MAIDALLHTRLRQQHLALQRFTRPDQVVSWMGAVQAQDFTAAKWGLGQRLRKATDDRIEQAFTDGSLLRTHVLRPTWHFVTPADIRWMVALSAPRLRRAMAYYLRQHGIDEATRTRSLAVIERELAGGRHLTRTELAGALVRARIATRERLLTDHVMGHIMGWAEIEALVCSGARRGKQFTYALLEERVPAIEPLSREEALAELSRRYFTSHGPATLRDFVWWSGLTLTEARLGVELARAVLAREERNGVQYWRALRLARLPADIRAAHLLPNYDEYTVAYADRVALMDAGLAGRFRTKISLLLTHTIVVNGQVVGTWGRKYAQKNVTIVLSPFRPLSRAERQAIDAAIERFSRFVAPLAVKVLSSASGEGIADQSG